MRALVLMLALVPPAALAEGACALRGSVSLKRDGEVLPVAGRVVVYVDSVATVKAARRPKKTWQVYQRDFQFEPQVLAVVMGDTVEFINKDKVWHSVFSRVGNTSFDFSGSEEETGQKSFETPGPVRVQCDIHGNMRSDILVLSNGFYAYADEKGRYEIKGLPEGDFKVVAWEPNGKRESYDVKGCSGVVEVPVLALEEAKIEKLRRKLGGEYAPYSMKVRKRFQ